MKQLSGSNLGTSQSMPGWAPSRPWTSLCLQVRYLPNNIFLYRLWEFPCSRIIQGPSSLPLPILLLEIRSPTPWNLNFELLV